MYLAAQTATVTRVIHPYSVLLTAEARTRDTTGESNDKYERAPRQGRNHWQQQHNCVLRVTSTGAVQWTLLNNELIPPKKSAIISF